MEERIHLLRLGQSKQLNDIEVRFQRIFKEEELRSLASHNANGPKVRRPPDHSSQPLESLVLGKMRKRSVAKAWQRQALLLLCLIPLCTIAAILFAKLIKLVAPHL